MTPLDIVDTPSKLIAIAGAAAQTVGFKPGGPKNNESQVEDLSAAGNSLRGLQL